MSLTHIYGLGSDTETEKSRTRKGGWRKKERKGEVGCNWGLLVCYQWSATVLWTSPYIHPSGSRRKSASFYCFDNNDSCLLCTRVCVVCVRVCSRTGQELFFAAIKFWKVKIAGVCQNGGKPRRIWRNGWIYSRREKKNGRWGSGGGGMKSIKTTLDGRRRKGSEEQEIIISYDEVRM